MARAAPIRPNSFGGSTDMPIEIELAIARALARHLWSLLERRRPVDATALWGDMTTDAKAIADRTFEASLILLHRHNIIVEPCRKLLDSQLDAPCRYIVKRPSGESEIIGEEQLLMMAGLHV